MEDLTNITPILPEAGDKLAPRDLVSEMQKSYLDYAMSVIVARALPDARDGLKPIHRRILYAMDEVGLRHTAKHQKSAKTVGEVMGNYHPQGDADNYESLVGMVKKFNMRLTLVGGQSKCR